MGFLDHQQSFRFPPLIFQGVFGHVDGQHANRQSTPDYLRAQVVTELVQSVAPIPPVIQERKQDVDTYICVYIYMYT